MSFLPNQNFLQYIQLDYYESHVYYFWFGINIKTSGEP